MTLLLTVLYLCRYVKILHNLLRISHVYRSILFLFLLPATRIESFVAPKSPAVHEGIV
jgi:hypothetical protein